MHESAIDGKKVSTLEKIISTVGELPASPAIVSTVMGLTSNLDSKLGDVTRVLSSDQSLTAKVLKLSNSSFFGRSKQVTTLREAILVLGFFNVRSLVVATSAHTMYGGEDKEGPKGKLWRHSLGAAVASRQIAEYISYPEREELFVAALLHDIGKLVMYQKLSDAYRRVIDEVEKTAGIFNEVEHREFGFGHCDVAAVLLGEWSFPTSLVQAIQYHHQLPDETDDEQLVRSVHLIRLGNEMAKKLEVGFKDGCADDLSELPSAQALFLDETGLDEIFENFQANYNEGNSILEGA